MLAKRIGAAIDGGNCEAGEKKKEKRTSGSDKTEVGIVTITIYFGVFTINFVPEDKQLRIFCISVELRK